VGHKKVSIIILTWNKLDFTKKCLAFLEKNTNYSNWEATIVDNGSKDGTRGFIEEFIKEKGNKYNLILNSTNKGYAAGVNQGIRAAEGDYILLLNNDVYVLKNWLISMVETLEKDEKNAIVGAKLIYPTTGRIQHAGVVFLRKIESLHLYKNSPPDQPRVNKYRYFDAVTGACMLIRKTIFKEVGFFDERFRFGGFEDIDFCLRCRIRGYKIIYSPTSISLHDESVSSSQIENYYKIFKQNYKLFLNKWGPLFRRYNDPTLLISFKLKMYLIYGIFKFIPNKFVVSIKKWLTTFLSVQ